MKESEGRSFTVKGIVKRSVGEKKKETKRVYKDSYCKVLFKICLKVFVKAF